MNNEYTSEERICTDYVISEETFGIATSLSGICKRKNNPHVFWLSADVISKNKIKKLKIHGNSQSAKFSLNYKLVAAMQQMGNGYTDIGTLVSFLDLPTCAETVAYNLRMVERVLGPVQLSTKDER